MSDKSAYAKESGFWQKTKPRVMGDFIGRPQAVSLLGNVRGMRILEAGAGTGYVARILASQGAVVVGCDKEPKMIQRALEEERRNPLGITYVESDITKTPLNNHYFEAVLCIGVLIHNDIEAVNAFFEEAWRLLVPSGILVVSVTHPFLFTSGSPSRNGHSNWVQHTPESTSLKSYGDSQIFSETYYDIEGKPFASQVWHHSISAYLNLILKRFRIQHIQEVVVKKGHLVTPQWGKEYGYPAFFQVKAHRLNSKR